jgi:hypothetical protein
MKESWQFSFRMDGSGWSKREILSSLRLSIFRLITRSVSEEMLRRGLCSDESHRTRYVAVVSIRLTANQQIPHMFLSPTSQLAARIWTPCLDSMWERCTWELEFTVPHTLPDRGDLPPFTVVSSGELMEQVSLVSRSTLMSDYPPSQSKQDYILLPSSKPDKCSAHPVRSWAVRDASCPPRGEEGNAWILSAWR